MKVRARLASGYKGLVGKSMLAAALILLCGCAGQRGRGVERTGAALDGPLVLFDGTNLAGWSQSGPGRFRLIDGTMKSEGGMGLLWYSDRAFGDFVLRLDWRVSASTDNSGVFLRFPDPGDDPWVAVNEGYEVQIYDDPGGDPQKTGAVYGFQPPSVSASRPTGEWNHYKVRVSGNDYTVWLNGVKVNHFRSTDPRRGLEGHIGLQNHDERSRVQFRDVRLQEL